MYLSLTAIDLLISIPDNGTCGGTEVAECSVNNSNRLDIEISGYDAETYYPNTFQNISLGPINVSRCDRSRTPIRLCLRLRDSVCSLIFIRRIATYFLSRGKS